MKALSGRTIRTSPGCSHRIERSANCSINPGHCSTTIRPSILRDASLSTCKESGPKRADGAATVINKIEVRLAEAVRRSGRTQEATALFRPILDRVSRLKEELRARAPLDYLSQCEEMEGIVGTIEERTRLTDAHDAFLQKCKRFSKDIMLSFFVTATIGFVLFPGVICLLHSFLPDFPSLKDGETWAGQKAIFLLGSLFGVIITGFRAFSGRGNPQKTKSECRTRLGKEGAR